MRDQENYLDMVRLFRSLGADPDCEDQYGVSPRKLAAKRKMTDLVAHFRVVTPRDIRTACMTRNIDAVIAWQESMSAADLRTALNEVVDFRLNAKPAALAFKHGNPEFFAKVLEFGADPDVCYPETSMKIVSKAIELARMFHKRATSSRHIISF